MDGPQVSIPQQELVDIVERLRAFPLLQFSKTLSCSSFFFLCQEKWVSLVGDFGDFGDFGSGPDVTSARIRVDSRIRLPKFCTADHRLGINLRFDSRNPHLPYHRLCITLRRLSTWCVTLCA
jgi:hypothetical protein